MKSEFLEKLEQFKNDIRGLQKSVKGVQGTRISKVSIRTKADNLASQWVEEIRSPLEHQFKIPESIISESAEQFKWLHILSRPNNLKKSYVNALKAILKDFDDKFILPIKQASWTIQEGFDVRELVPGVIAGEESEYIGEALGCAKAGFLKAAVVLGWCAAIDRIQRKLMLLGLSSFNTASKALKDQTSGKFSRWKKEFSVTTLSELQGVFDRDLIVVLQGMSLLDGNQAERLETCFQYRNHSAHPGEAPIEEAHVIAFFKDINSIVFENSKFTL